MSIYQGGTKPYPEWEEEQQKLKIRTRPIGSKATLKGKPVVWAGPDYGWQSPESFKKLDDAEYFAPTERLARTGLKVLDKLSPVGEFIGQVGQGLYGAFIEPYQGPLQKQIMTNTAEAVAAIPEVIGHGADKLTPHGTVGPATGLFIGALGQELIESRLPLIKNLPSGVKNVAKRNALTRYNELTQLGWDFRDNARIQRQLSKLESGQQVKSGTTIWDNKKEYRAAAKKYIADGGASADIRKDVGVFVDEEGTIHVMQSRGKLTLRNETERVNTELNRLLSTYTQSGNLTPYSSVKNKRKLMKDMGFTGTIEEFNSKFAVHHRNSISTFQPFYEGLSPEQAQNLTALLAKDGITVGDNPANLVALTKAKHTLDADSIHTWMRENGIEGMIDGYDPQTALTTRLSTYSVNQRYAAIKLYQEYVQSAVNEQLDYLTKFNST